MNTHPTITKQQALAAFGGPAALAKALGITSQAVSQWGDTVPRLRAYDLQRLRPDLFQVGRHAA